MRISGIAHNLLLVSLLISPAFICAQFKQPTNEELKMTSDPKAPGAAAVYLNIEETTDDDLHYKSFYVRIKVLTEKGKELATVDLPYVKSDTRIIANPGVYGTQATSIDEFKGRTIHPDGTVIPMTAGPADLFNSMKEGINGEIQYNRKVFTLPSVEVGSILEYSYKLRFDDFVLHPPNWEVQREYYIHKSHYDYTPPKEFLSGLANYFINENGKAINTLVMWQDLPAGVTVKRNVKGHFSLDVNDIPPMPNEDWMPPIQNLRLKVHFYLTAEGSINDFWP